jgi:glycosyltransferase involved in cell wall biosynthesis
MHEVTDPAVSAGALPAVDVVIATHNRPELLRVALAAVLGQTYAGQINVFLVFDRSEPDQSLASSASNRSVVVTTNTRSPGLAGARNSGILAGGSPFVAFCDDDDEWLPTKVAEQVGALGSSDALTSVTGIIVHYGDHEVVRVPKASDVTLDNLVRDRVMEAHPSTVLVRRSALAGAIGMVDEEIPGSYGEDFDWILRAAQAGSFAVVEQALVKVRWGQSLFSQNWQTIIDSIDYGLKKHAAFSANPQALGRLYGRRAFALAALGRTGPALRQAGRTVRVNPRERRAYLAGAVALHLVSAERLMRFAHSRGHGI